MNEPPRRSPREPRRAIPIVAAIAALGVLVGVYFALHGGDASPPPPPAVDAATNEVAELEVAPEPIERIEPEVAPAPRRPREMAFPEARFSDPAQTVWGHVVDAVTKQPIDFFQTYLVPVEVGDVLAVAERQEYVRIWGNSKGAFTYREVAEGKYGLLVRRDGYRDVIFRDFVIPNHRGLLEIELQRGAYIEVEVVDGDELEGIGGIETFLRPVSLDDPNASLPSVLRRETDDYGKGLFTGLPAGTWKVELGNRKLSAQPEYQVYVGADVGVPVRFVIQPLNTVTVTVKDEQGETLNGVHVRMWSKDGNGTFRDDTDIDGEAVMSHVPPGTYTVKIWKPGYFRDDREIVIGTLNGEFATEFEMVADPLADKGGSEANPTLEQIQELKIPVNRPSDVFKKKKP